MGFFTTLKNAWRKNVPELIAWRDGSLPEFITAQKPKEPLDGIPVFCYHIVEHEFFELDLKFLQHNGYVVLSTDEFVACLTGKSRVPDRCAVLTFDDGARNFYEVAFPLLKKYRVKVTHFIAPGLHSSTTEDGDTDARPMTWPEIAEMHASGLVSFQSHTYESRYVPTWPTPAALAGCAPSIEMRRRGFPREFADDLFASMEALKERLPGRDVKQLAFPMYLGTDAAVAQAQSLGFSACYWGLVQGRPLNRVGDSPYYVSRISDEFLRRLPGEGRLSMAGLLHQRLHRVRLGRAWRRRFPEPVI